MSTHHNVARRLLPLRIAAFFGGIGLWVPVEKLFMNEIGFDAASVGLLAAVYAGVVPFLEIPSGILADRWSRRGVLVIGYVALSVGAVIGGLSTNVPTYLVSALGLGVFFAMRSGTLESLVYDTVLEETNDSATFERHLGRVQLTESIALMLSALAGGVIAAISSPRVTYFITAPLIALSIVALAAFREPHLHRADDSPSLRNQIGTTYRTILERGRIRQIIILMVFMSVLLQAILEFGPLWLVAMAAPAFLFGPHWAGLMGALGLGSVLGDRVPTSRTGTARLAAVLVAGTVVLTVSHHAAVVIVVQATLSLVLVALSIVLTRKLHDAIPSTIRAGVASGVGTVTWIAFVPFALAFGFVSNRVGVFTAGWMLVGVALASAVVMVRFACDGRTTSTGAYPTHALETACV